MNIASLASMGIGAGIVGLWRSAGHETLLPVQQLAIERCGVLKGHNLLVFSPTSSGKTFVGEVAAIRMARQNRRVIYLVPQKALAEEKFEEFHRKYAPVGTRVVISTRDRKEFDQDISRGLFHIAVIVFEKMQGLLVNSPGLLGKVGLVVVDELQLLSDRERGPRLEILLTRIRMAPVKPQVIGLSAVLEGTRDLAGWFGAGLCSQDTRPVELRKGVLCNGCFHYREHNSGAEGVETLAPVGDGDDPFVAQVRAFVDAGEQCLVFCRSRNDTLEAAKRLARVLPKTPAAGALADVRDLDDSLGRDVLSALLEHRVAYHNADLDWDQRRAIEQGFREGEIAVICATTTLAMGINLPARNVFIDPERWRRDEYGNWGTVSITQAEYENMSGRAGRLGFEEEFGRAIIITESEFQAEVLYENFVQGILAPILPALNEDPLARHILDLVASRLCRTQDEVRELLLSSYTGETCWRGGTREAAFDKALVEGFEQCLTGGLMEDVDGGLEATRLGRLAAVKGVTVGTAIAMAKYARENREAAEDLHLLEVLFCLSGTEDGRNIHFGLSTREWESGHYHRMMGREYLRLDADAQARLAWLQNGRYRRYEPTKRIKATLLLYEWAMGTPTREIEERFCCQAGSAQGLATEFAWLAETFYSVARICEWRESALKALRDVPARLLYGVPPNGLEIASVRIRGLGRGRVMSLVDEGLDTIPAIAEAPQTELENVIGRRVASRLRRCVTAIREREPFHKEGPNAEAAGIEEATDIEAAWSDAVPPSDDLGIPYRSDAKVHFDGRPDRRRRLLVIDGRETWLREASFEAALKLAVAARTTQLGWVSAGAFGESETSYQVIRRLKQDLAPSGIDPESLVENNGAKQYRCSAPPANLTFDVPRISLHFPEGVPILARLGSDGQESV